MKKKILSMVLALCMVLTLLPITAFATGTYGQTTQYTVPSTTAAVFAVGAASGTDYLINGNNITISTENGLTWLTLTSAYWASSYTITLSKDFVCSDFVWSRIGSSSTTYFSGTLDGQGHTVSGITGNNYYSSIYNYYNAGTVGSNDATNGYNVSGIIGWKYSSTESCCDYLTGFSQDGNNKVQAGIGVDTINTTGTDTDGHTNAFSGTGASCVLSNASYYTISDSTNTSCNENSQDEYRHNCFRNGAGFEWL